MNLFDGRHLQQRSKKNAAQSPATAAINNKVTEKIEITPDETPQSPETKLREILLSWLDDRLRYKLQPGYSERSMAIDDGSRSWVRNCRYRAFFRNLITDEKYENVALFLRAFIIRNWHRPKVVLSNHSVLFLQDVMSSYDTTDPVHENSIVTEVADFNDKALLFRDSKQALSIYAHRRTNVLQQSYTNPESFLDPCKHHELSGQPVIRRTHLISQHFTIWKHSCGLCLLGNMNWMKGRLIVYGNPFLIDLLISPTRWNRITGLYVTSQYIDCSRRAWRMVRVESNLQGGQLLSMCWLRKISAMMVLDITEDEVTYLLVIGDWYLPTGCDCPEQSAGSYFEVRKGRSS